MGNVATSTTSNPRVDQRDRLAKALAHPLRQRILEILNRRVASPRDIAEELGAKLADVGYHVRMLRSYGAIELVRTEQRRGAIKHYYRATTRVALGNDQWEQLPVSARLALFGQTLEVAWGHVRKGVEQGGFEPDGARVLVQQFELDERGYRQMVKLIDGLVAKALEIQAGVVARRANSAIPEGERRTELVALHFLPDGEPSRRGR
jgi:DNA-binding transcriptional ArsR family regulator